MNKPIPMFIDEYNLNMNHVDTSDQIRADNDTKRKCYHI